MDDYLTMIRENCTMVLTPKKKREPADIEQAIIDVQEAVLELHKQKKNGTLTPAAFNKELCIHKQKLDELQERQKVLYEQQGNTLAVAYWLNQFHDATDDRDGSIMKTLVEAIIVWDDRIEVRFKCGATVEQKYVA